jgi:nicotinamidase/pyrazinamidase
MPSRSKLVFVDVDTQADFVLPGGKLYVRGAERLLPTIQRLTQAAQQQGIPIISSTDAHRTDDPEFESWPPHCIRGTSGQLKVPESLCPQYLVVPQEREAPLAEQELQQYRQWIVEKDDLDAFSNPHAGELVSRLDADQYVVYGVATEFCVRLAVLGLRKRNRKTLLLTDAIRGIDEAGVKKTLQELQDAGAQLASTQDFLTGAVAA